MTAVVVVLVVLVALVVFVIRRRQASALQSKGAANVLALPVPGRMVKDRRGERL